MNKALKALKALWWVARRPVLLNRVLADPEQWEKYVKGKYPFAEGLPVIGMDRLIGSGTVSLGPMTFLDGGSLPTDMMLLAGLAEGIPGCTYFEIGTWRGESAAIVASRALSCHTLSLTDREMQRMGVPDPIIRSHRLFSEGIGNITHLRGDSRYFDFAALDMKFDLVFIDGAHQYDFVLSDTKKVFEHLAHENTVVVWHDYGTHPDQVRFEVMAAILDGAGPERAERIYHVAHTKSAVFTGKTYPSKPAEFPVIPEEYYNLELTRKTR
jgi:predicted O-methyltransferase YrrM